MGIIAGAGNPAGSGGSAGTGKGLNYIGAYAFAYSGEVSVNNVETDLLNFSTGSGVIIATLNFNKNTGDGDDIQYQAYVNSEVIQGWIHDYSARGYRNIVNVIIPPYSQFKATATNDTSSTGRNVVCSLTAEVSNA